jgi:hypothetical protein
MGVEGVVSCGFILGFGDGEQFHSIERKIHLFLNYKMVTPMIRRNASG